MGYRRLKVSAELILKWCQTGEHRECFTVENGIPEGARIVAIRTGTIMRNTIEILMSHEDWPADVNPEAAEWEHEGGFYNVPEISPVFRKLETKHKPCPPHPPAPENEARLH